MPTPLDQLPATYFTSAQQWGMAMLNHPGVDITIKRDVFKALLAYDKKGGMLADHGPLAVPQSSALGKKELAVAAAERIVSGEDESAWGDDLSIGPPN